MTLSFTNEFNNVEHIQNEQYMLTIMYIKIPFNAKQVYEKKQSSDNNLRPH